ncbi:MAG: type II secretion system protein [Deferribacterales bacterium]
MKNNKGFTLVELAIVLMIIGVILGGVIKGTELLNNAKLKRVYRDFQNIQTGYLAYYDRNGVAPGFKGGSTWSSANFWDDLYNGGNSFFGTSANAPKDAFGTALTVANDGGSSALGSANKFSGTYVICDSVTTAYAVSLDKSFDNDTATTGNLRYATAEGATTSTICMPLD